MKRVVQVILVGAYIWFFTSKIITQPNSNIWREEWVRVVVYTVVPLLIWEGVIKFWPKKKRKFK